MNRVAFSLFFVLSLLTGGLLGQTETQPAPAKDATAITPAANPAPGAPAAAAVPPPATNAAVAPALGANQRRGTKSQNSTTTGNPANSVDHKGDQGSLSCKGSSCC